MCQVMHSVETMARCTNLSVNANGNRRVPDLYLNSDGSVNRDWNNWDDDWNVDNCLVLLCDLFEISSTPLTSERCC